MPLPETESAHLTEVQVQALDFKRQRQIARTILAWEAYAEHLGVEDEQVESVVVGINAMGTPDLKKLRKALKAAVSLETLLPTSEVELADEPEAVTTAPQTAVTEPLTEKEAVSPVIAEPQEQQAAAVIAPEPEESVAVVPEPTAPIEEVVEPAAEEVTPPVLVEEAPTVNPGLEWAAKLLGNDYDLTGDVRKIAEDIYAKAGSPKTRRQHKSGGGRQIEPVERIMNRLNGMSNQAIAEADETTRSAVDQWFRSFIERKIAQPQPVKVEPVKPAEPAEEKPASPPAPKAVPPVIIKPEAFDRPPRDYPELAKEWAKLLGFDDEECEMLTDIFNPMFAHELNGNHKRVRHILRQYMEKHEINFYRSEYDLSSGEIARLNQLLGAVRTGDGPVYSGQLSSVAEVSRENGYYVTQRQSEVLSALDRVLNGVLYTNAAAEAATVEEVDPLETLRQQDFDDEEIEALKVCFTFDDDKEYEKRPEITKQALAHLQRVLAFSGGALKAEGVDPRMHQALSMITNMAFGPKTINDVYYKLHGLDERVTRDDVAVLIRSGIAILAAE